MGNPLAHKIKKTWEFIGLLDDDLIRHNSNILGSTVVGSLSYLEKFSESCNDVDLVISIGDPKTRNKIVDKLYESGGFGFPGIIHPLAFVPDDVSLGKGVIIYPNTTIDPSVIISDFVFINKNVSIGHDTTIGQYSVISPGSSIGGNTNIAKSVFVGMGAQIIQGLDIGENSTVGAGAVVLKNVPENVTVVGCPARIIQVGSQ